MYEFVWRILLYSYKNGEIIDTFTVHKDCLKFVKKISSQE